MPQIGAIVSPRNKSDLWKVVGTFPTKLYLENLADPKKPIKIVMRYNFRKGWKVKETPYSNIKPLIIREIKKNLGY